MQKSFYNVGDRFNWNGTIYTIQTLTHDALEIASTAEQSLWVSLNEFHENLGLKTKSALFDWQNKYLVKN